MKDAYWEIVDGNLTSVDLMLGHDVGQLIDHTRPAAYVSRVRTQPGGRNKGTAKRVMQQVCDDADEEQLDLFLEVAPDEPDMDYGRLCHFYQLFGFKHRRSMPGIMVRRFK